MPSEAEVATRRGTGVGSARIGTRVCARIGTPVCEYDGAANHFLGYLGGHFAKGALVETEFADLGLHGLSLSLVRAAGLGTTTTSRSSCFPALSVGGTYPTNTRRPNAPANTSMYGKITWDVMTERTQ